MVKWFTRINTLVVSFVMILVTSINPVEAATDDEINAAISNGLAWLASTQNTTTGIFGSLYPLANTCAAVLAMENEGHFPGGSTAYSFNVEKGLDYILSRGFFDNIYVQTHGYPGRNDDPDSDGDGKGIYFSTSGGRAAYETGMVMQAIVASNTPDRVVSYGALKDMTYREVLIDVIDWLAWGQCDGGTGRGGWRYYPYNNTSSWSDNSVAQWPVLGFIAAEQWGLYAPDFVKTELEYWVSYIQNANGGSGYDHPGSLVNIAKTGGLLVEFFWLGDDKTTPRVQNALNYINSRWNVGPYSTWYGNKGHGYAMFGVFKGLELMEVETIPAAPANSETPAGDWWGDYCEFIVNTQNISGGWNGYSYVTPWMTSGWYIVILQATVFPVQVAVELPEGNVGCDSGYDITVNYSVERFEAEGTLELLKFDGSEFVNFETITLDPFIGEHEYTFSIESDASGTSTWKAVLNVTGGGITTSAEDQATITVCETPTVTDIPDQFSPFETFDLDDFGLADEWTAVVPEGATGWTVVIDGENVVTVTAPVDAVDPVTISFVAKNICSQELECSNFDDATFTPIKLVAFDIKPTSWPNPFNVKANGVLPAAILGTADFDVTTVDPATITLEGVPLLRWDYEDVTGPVEGDGVCNDTEDGPDGFMDMTLKFDRQELVAALGEVSNGDELVLTLKGNQFIGTPIEGDDCIIIKKNGGKNNQALAEEMIGVPDEFALYQNFPNPFNPSTSIKFALPNASYVKLTVFNSIGQEVAVLHNAGMEAGFHTIDFDASGLNSGIYFYRISADNFVEIKKMLLIK